MRRHRQSFWTNILASLIFSVLCGIICILLLSLLFSSIEFYVLKDIQFSGIFSAVSITAGSFVSAYICGRYRRRKGLIEGALCGVCLFVAISVFALIFVGKIPSLKKLLLLSLTGMAGGIIGVNSKRPKNLTS